MFCKTHDIEFKNQSFNQFITQLKNRFFDSSVERYIFTKAERATIYDAKPCCNSCKKKITKSQMQLDHITKLNSSAIINKKQTKNIFSKDLTIYEDITVDKFMDMESCIVIYSKHDLSIELDDRLRIYKIIPAVRNRKSNHIRIDFEYNRKNYNLGC